jgi:hypothetical protein
MKANEGRPVAQGLEVIHLNRNRITATRPAHKSVHHTELAISAPTSEACNVTQFTLHRC